MIDFQIFEKKMYGSFDNMIQFGLNKPQSLFNFRLKKL